MKQIIILGDVEMGGGTYTDDFISDKALSELILKLSRQKNPIELVFNGDTFDFLKCPYIHKKQKSYPRHITSSISLSKLKMIYEAHKRVFDALNIFLKGKGNLVYFVIGNHDPDLFFIEVQRKIRHLLGFPQKIFFDMSYQRHSIYAEHGHQYDFLNKMNKEHLFLDFKGEPILNIPWVSFGLISRFMTMKEEHPFLERIKPLPVLFSHQRAVVRKISLRSMEYLFKSIFYYPIRYYYDPTYTFPKDLLREFYRRFKNVHWDVDKITEKYKKHEEHIKRHKLHVLSHIHQKYVEEKDNWVIIHPDTWRDEYLLDNKTYELRAREKHYVEIIVHGENIKWKIKHWPIKRTKLPFWEVVADEPKFLKIAAQEEGFRS